MSTCMRYHWYWRPGWQPGTRFYTFHVTWRDQPGVQKLGERARERLAGIRGLDPVPGSDTEAAIAARSAGVEESGRDVTEEMQGANR